jgi:hypothetical protein
MIQARVHHGRIEVQEPIPESWEGRLVGVVPLTPNDPLPDLETSLAALHALGPTEFEPGEQEWIARELSHLDRMTASEAET